MTENAAVALRLRGARDAEVRDDAKRLLMLYVNYAARCFVVRKLQMSRYFCLCYNPDVMIYACPRCTQLLPADAAFCRRCGAMVEFRKQSPASPGKKQTSLLTPILAALLTGGLIFAGFVFVHVPSTTANYTNVPVQPVYSDPVIPEVPTYMAPVVVTPVYPTRPLEPMREEPRIHRYESKR